MVRTRSAAGRQSGQALVETALVLPVILYVAFAVVGIGRVTQARMAVESVAREAARAEASADTADWALAAGAARGRAVADGYGLTNGTLALALEPGTLARGDVVTAMARYTVSLGDLPLLGWARIPVAGTARERVDLYRSRWDGDGQ